MSNPVVQWQIVAPDAAATAKFYRELFGWEITAQNALGYRQVTTGEGGTPGGIWPSPPDQRPFVQLFIAVPDVAAACQSAQALGAKVIVPRSVLPDGDVMAVLADPSGLTFGLMQS